MPNHRVCFFGGTGFIGHQVLQTFIKTLPTTGHHTVVLVSRHPQIPWLHTLQTQHPSVHLQHVPGDIVQDPSLESLWAKALRAQTWTHLFYSVQFPGHPVEHPEKGWTYENYDYGGLRNVLNVLKPSFSHTSLTQLRASVPLRCVYISGAGAGQNLQKPWFQAKDKAEALLTRFSEDTKGTFLALRPSVVYGAKDRSVNALCSLAEKVHCIPLMGSQDIVLQPLYVEDLAKACVDFGFCHNGAMLNGAFDLPGPENITLKHLIQLRLNVLGIQAKMISLPLPVVKWGSKILKHLPGHLMNPNAVDFLTQQVLMKPPDILLNFIKNCLTPEEGVKQY